MIDAFGQAGFFAAHSIWSVSSGETLIPILASVKINGEKKMERIVAATFEESVAKGQEMLKTNAMGAVDAVLLYDGRITIGDTKYDAILMEIKTYVSPDSEAILAIPYTPKKSFFSKFKVHRPKLLAWNNCDRFDQTAALQAFFDGVESHKEGAKIWHKCQDDSK